MSTPELPPEVTGALNAWRRAPVPLRLSCGIQHYGWGQRGRDAFIPRLLGRVPEEGRPYAELWIGAHPVLPSIAHLGEHAIPLHSIIAAAPETVLGGAYSASHGRELPFLMKVLAAAVPLSIQAHPTRGQAEQGFDREEAAGIPLQAPNRNYRDRNHKPELIVALTPFYALKGFRPVWELRELLCTAPELRIVAAAADAAVASAGSPGDVTAEGTWVRALFEACLSPAPETSRCLQDLVARLAHEDRRQPFGTAQREHWLLRASREVVRPGAPDRGLLAVLLLNLVRLEPGQALYLEAGELHAYLEGVGIEVMANSDNVLRGGLTQKHVDVPELLRTLVFEAAPPRVLSPDGEGVYRSPSSEFEVACIELAAGARRALPAGRPSTLLVLDGELELHSDRSHDMLRRGNVVFCPAATSGLELVGSSESARLFCSSART